MDLKDLKEETLIMLSSLGIKNYGESFHTGGLAYEFSIKEFGIIVCALNIKDIVFVRSKLSDNYKNWRIFYLTTDDDLVYKKEELFFELMRCGYIKWLRTYHHRYFINLLHTTDVGNKIIKKRLSIWGDKPKYKFLIEDNKDALEYPAHYLLSLDNGFFDYMPEIE